MVDDGLLQPPPTRMLSGDEPIVGTPALVRDFWAWTLSDLRTNTVRPMLAEFLVAQALGATAQPRIEWDAYDVVTPDGVRVEVKSSAYLQAWTQARPSSIRFGGLNGRTWDPTAGYAAAASYNADVYVFAVVTTRDHALYDPLDSAQWSFWVLPRADRGGHRAAQPLARSGGGAGRPFHHPPRTGPGSESRRFLGQGVVMTVELRGEVVRVDEVPGAVPSEPGLYAWWSLPGALPGIAGPLHPDDAHELLYVGIARSGPSSHATLRSRVVGNHIRGTTGQSTLRRSLASLLYQQEGWRSRFTDRPLLVPDDETRLNEWMQENLALSWAVHEHPWTVEAQVITELTPPLNQSANSSHPMYRHVREARRRWREAARAAVAERSDE